MLSWPYETSVVVLELTNTLLFDSRHKYELRCIASLRVHNRLWLFIGSQVISDKISTIDSRV